MNNKRPRLQKLSAADQDLMNQAQRLFEAGQLLAASECCDRVIASRPRNPEPHLLKSWANMQMGEFFTAREAVREAATLLPADAGVQAWAAEVCSEAADLKSGETYRAQAIRLDSRQPAVLSSIAASLTNEEQYGEALPYYQQLAKREPENLSLRLNAAFAARFAGDMELAEAHLQQILKRNPDAHQASFELSQLRTATAEQNRVDALAKALARAGDNTEARAFLGYALGKEYEDLAEFEKAFEHYALGAATQGGTQKSAGDETAVARSVENAFRQLPKTDVSDRGAGMIFIIGLPRTGTTLLDRMLGAHSEVVNAGELNVFPFVTHRHLSLPVRGLMAPGVLGALPTLNFREIGETYLECLPNRLRASDYVTDKNPQNYLYAGLIARALPAATIVHMRRDPMDACFASYKQLFSPGAYPHSYDLKELAAHYASYEALTKLWEESLGERYVEMHYEDLVADSEAEVRRILSVCGLAWQTKITDFHQRNSAVGTASYAQVRRPVYSSSVQKWRRFERQLAPLAEALLDAGIPLS